MIYIGVDLHQGFCYMTMMDASGAIGDQRQVLNDAESLRKYFQQWPEPVEAAVEACSFWQAFVDTVSPLVARLVLVHPQGVKAIAWAKLKNDRVDSETLARVRQSGEHTRSGHITREGSRNLRWILVEAAQVAPRCSPGARRYFDRLARRKPRKVARVALARKLLGAVYALLRHGVCFDEQVFAAM